MQTFPKLFFESGLDWMLGNGCAVCGSSPAPQGWCPEHWREVREQESTRLRCRHCALYSGRPQEAAKPLLCTDCLAHPPLYIAAYVGGDYQAPWDTLVKDLKFSGKTEKARALATLLDAAIPSGLALDLLVSVPAWPAKLAQRGFNAPALIGAALARQRSWNFDALGLEQVRELPDIHLLGARERMQAVQDAFVARRSLSAMRVGLIDDVMTTGATLQAATTAALAAGARLVVLLAALRTPRER
jgi:ComF family protein